MFPDASDALAYYGEPSKCKGAFYGGDGSAVAANLVFILAVIAWTCGTCMTLFMAIKMTIGMRVDKEMEVSAFCRCLDTCLLCRPRLAVVGDIRLDACETRG